MYSTNKDFLLQLLQQKSLLNFDILIPFREFENELVNELIFISVRIVYTSEKLIITEPLKIKPIYAQDWWPRCEFFSLKEHLKLKELPHWGCYYHFDKFKNEKSVRSSIKNLELKRIDWKMNHPFDFKFFTWTVFDEFIFYCRKPFERFPLGWHEFNEDKVQPPSRAYLKLWEIFLTQDFFDFSKLHKSQCIEVGCSPGGWTWVLAQYFKSVCAVDKAPLAPQLSEFKNITFLAEDAFKLTPSEFKTVRWFFSDIICTPQRMNSLVNHWLTDSTITHFVSTIKFKGAVDFKFLHNFQIEKSLIGKSTIIHLYHNKNEVTWLFKRNEA
jgi:23S rRNA (cytidine2498-2'-O)-methyltransferase